MAMAISCFLTAIDGTFCAHYFRHINPERDMGISLSIEIVLVGVVGGWQSVLGPAIDSLLLSPTSEIIRGEFGGSYAGLHLGLYRLLSMVVSFFLPKGINEPLTRALNRLEAKIRLRPAAGPLTSAEGRRSVPGALRAGTSASWR
jgi:branched-chain amino acid transport system permease protein